MSQMGFPGSSVVKNLPAMQETWVCSLGQEDPLEEGMATHSNTLAYRVLLQTRSLVGYSSQGHTELDITDATKQQHVPDTVLTLSMHVIPGEYNQQQMNDFYTLGISGFYSAS